VSLDSVLALLGCGAGVLGSLALSRLVSSFLFEVRAADPLTYIMGALIMMRMALLAIGASRNPCRTRGPNRRLALDLEAHRLARNGPFGTHQSLSHEIRH
jgi:hypothetical protein